MMACDSMEVLDQLVRAGLWSAPGSISDFRRVVLDVDGIVLSLHRLCITNHLKRLQSIKDKKSNRPDLYSATLVNYTEFARLVKQLLDYFHDQKIEPILVYAGKPMEAPLFGLLAAEFKKNTQKVSESIKMVNDYDKHGNSNGYLLNHTHNRQQPGRPNLALIIFKSIVNIRRRTGAKLHAVQAYYSAYPQLAKMARDYMCPVITNNGDFIIMDVRAGFMLFDEFWFQCCAEKHNLATEVRSAKASSLNSGTKSKVANHVTFHYNRLFLKQHPGLNAPLAMNLFPLTTVDFVTTYGNSLKRLNVFDTGYKERDFMPADGGRKAYRKHHLAANRLEMVLLFLTSKTVEIMGNMIRGEATRTNTSFDDDFRNLFYYYAAAYEFKHRLRFALKYLHDPVQLNYIEWCLVNRECTADYLLDMLCCSIGRLATVSYNKGLQFEDFQTKHSAYWLKNHAKSMLMSLFTANKSHKGEHSVSSKNKQQQDTVTRYSTASLTIVDRQQATLTESILTTTHENNSQLDAIRPRLQLADIAHRKISKRDSVKFINLAFKSADITHIPPKLEALVAKYLRKDEHSIRNELAVVRSLFVYSHQSAFPSDGQSIRDSYSPFIHQFEVAIVNHYLYVNETLSNQKQAHLSALVNLIKKLDFENVAINELSSISASSTGSEIQSHSSVKSLSRNPKSSGKKHQKDQVKLTKSNTSHRQNNSTSKHIRHLIELLGTSIEAYCELNSFFDYPLPRLNIYLHYNPILLFNLTLYASNEVLIKF